MTTTDDPHAFRAMMERVGGLGSRLQIDLMDGVFAPNRNLDPARIWWPAGVQADIHLMYKHPKHYLDLLLGLQPHMIIVHAEAADDVVDMLFAIRATGVLAGVALLPPTDVNAAAPLLVHADHILLFAGELGGSGKADLNVLDKIPAIKKHNPTAEIGWDGGANEANVTKLATAGVDVINVGNVLRQAENPATVYAQLTSLIS